MTWACEACGGTTFGDVAYESSLRPPSFRRTVADLIKYVGWRYVPRILWKNTALAPRFAEGLFKFAKVRVCLFCDLGKMVPLPSDCQLTHYYTDFYSSEATAKGLGAPSARAESQYYHLTRYVELGSNPTTFEFGAGDAGLSRLIKRDRPQAHVVAEELSSGWLAALNGIVDEATPAYNGPNSFFDMVLSSHALEHVRDVRASLARWRHLLKPGGIVFFEIPEGGKTHNRAMPAWQPHTYFFSVKSLGLLAEQVGLEIVRADLGGPLLDEYLSGEAYPASENWLRDDDRAMHLRVIMKRIGDTVDKLR